MEGSVLNPWTSDPMMSRVQRPWPGERGASRCDRVGYLGVELSHSSSSHRRALSAPLIPTQARLHGADHITIIMQPREPFINNKLSSSELNDQKTSQGDILVGGSSETQAGRTVVRTKGSDISCRRLSVYSVLAAALVCVGVVLGRDYIKYVLLSLETSNFAVSFLVFLVLFIAVSFPMTWGYILLNVAAGYLYGPLTGVAVVMGCALCGVLTAHLVIRGCLREVVWERIANESMRALVKVVNSESGAKVVALARLTPIPFGLQNALFAVS